MVQSATELELEQEIRQFYADLRDAKIAGETRKQRASELFEKLVKAKKKRKLTGYEASKVPTLRNLSQ